MLTPALLLAIATLAAAGAWRLSRWYWRPRLVLPDDVHLELTPNGVNVWLEVRNEGAGRSRHCRAVLVRCERREAVGWLRIEALRAPDTGFAPESSGETDPRAGGTCIPAGESKKIRLDRRIPDVPGIYRLDIAALNGEEKRSSYVVEVDAASADGPDRVEEGGREGT
jgi:hypothetical protein